MRLSHLILAVAVIVYAALQLGADMISMKLFWWLVIVGVVVWIIEGIFKMTSIKYTKHIKTVA